MSGYSADQIEIRRSGAPPIYDIYVDGHFRTYVKTFEDAVETVEKIRKEHTDVIQRWTNQPKKGGKIRK